MDPEVKTTAAHAAAGERRAEGSQGARGARRAAAPYGHQVGSQLTSMVGLSLVDTHQCEPPKNCHPGIWG